MANEFFLEGTRVIDLTSFLSGPFCTMLLADMGADVLKIEPPSGDAARHIPPHFVDGDSLYFHTVNRNKRSVVLDLKDADGRTTFLDLLANADVVVENFRPGVMARLGLELSALRSERPHLVTASITGFGANTAYAELPAYDVVVQAMSGGMSLTGNRESGPVRMGIPIADLAAGMYAALGIAAAIARRERSGQGAHIDVSMFDSQIAMLGYQASYYLFSGEVPGPQGAGHVSIPTYRDFRCEDGVYVVVAANTEGMWKGLCRAMGLTDLENDVRFATNADRLRNAEALWERLEAAFATMPSQTVVKRLRDEGVPAASVNSVAEALNDPVVLQRNMIATLVSEDGTCIEVPANPIKADGMRPEDQYSFPPRFRVNLPE